MNRITTDTLLRNEAFRKSEFSGNSVVIPYTSEGALARMKKLEVVETRQEKREGYNLFNIDTVTNHFLNSKTGAVAANNSWRLSDFIEVKAMADYLFSWTSSSSYFQVTIAMYDENKIFLNGLEYGISNIYKKVFQTIENCKYVKIAYAVRVNSTDVTRENIMLAEGTEEKPYEPFGVMPSLDYPSEIEHIGDNIQLFDKDTISANKYINLGNGALGNSTTSNTSDYIKVYANEEYVLSYEYETLLATGKRVCCYFDENKNYIKGIEYTSTNKETVFVAQQNGYIRFSYDINAYNVKLEKGTKSTSYSEFGQGSVEIRKSKANVYDISKFTQGFWNSAANTGVTGWLCKVVKGQKVIVNKKNNKLDYVIGLTTLDYRDSTNVRISESGWQSGEKFEMTAIDDGYIFLQVKKNNNSNITSAELLADGFEIYCVNKTHILQIQRKMLKGDYFDIANKKEVHKWDKVILTGDENISMSNSQNVNYFGINSITLEDFEYIDDNTTNYMCTHFNAIKVSERYKYNTMFINSAKRIVLCCNEFSNVDDFKVKLAELYNEGKAVEIYYKLATPLELDCTEEQIAVLKELENMTTYADKTIIATDNDMTEMTVEAEQSRISMIEEKLKKEETV